MRRIISKRNSTLGMLSLAVLLAGGCNTAPQGNTGGLIDPTRRTGIDANAPGADSVSLLEFADITGQQMAADIARVPEIKGSPTKVIIEMGSIQNRTDTPSSDFDAMQREVFSTLVRSDVARDVAQFRERFDRVSRDAAGMQGQVIVDPTGREAPRQVGAAVEQSDLNYVYFLQGTFSELSRAGGIQSTYVLNFSLVKGTNRSIVWTSPQYRFKQVRGR